MTDGNKCTIKSTHICFIITLPHNTDKFRFKWLTLGTVRAPWRNARC